MKSWIILHPRLVAIKPVQSWYMLDCTFATIVISSSSKLMILKNDFARWCHPKEIWTTLQPLSPTRCTLLDAINQFCKAMVVKYFLVCLKESNVLNILDLMITFPECWSHNCKRAYNWKLSGCKSVRTKSSSVENMKCNLVLNQVNPKHELQTLKWQNPGILHEPQGNSGKKK